MHMLALTCRYAHTHANKHTLPLTPSLNHTTQTERYRQVIGEKESVVQYTGGVQGGEGGYGVHNIEREK